MEITFKNDKRNVDILFIEESANQAHIADIEASFKINSDGTGEFYFDNDGWFHEGKGRISFEKNQIRLNIFAIKNNNEYSNQPSEVRDSWKVHEGETVFEREQDKTRLDNIIVEGEVSETR